MSLLDKLGGFLGGGLGGKIADIIGSKIANKAEAEAMRLEIEKAIGDRAHAVEMALIESERNAEQQLQETVRAELAQSDLYTKQTRPKLARQSWYGAMAYVAASVVSMMVTQINDIPIDWSILTVILSPVLTYMGVRTFDKWKIGK